MLSNCFVPDKVIYPCLSLNKNVSNMVVMYREDLNGFHFEYKKHSSIGKLIVSLRGTSDLGKTASAPLILWLEFSFYLGFKSS